MSRKIVLDQESYPDYPPIKSSTTNQTKPEHHWKEEDQHQKSSMNRCLNAELNPCFDKVEFNS